MCGLIMALSSLVVLAARDGIAAAYTTDLAVRELAVWLLLFVAAFQIPDGLQVGSAGALRGFKDANVPMALNFAAYWLVGFPAAWWFGIHQGCGPSGIWAGLIAGLVDLRRVPDPALPACLECARGGARLNPVRRHRVRITARILVLAAALLRRRLPARQAARGRARSHGRGLLRRDARPQSDLRDRHRRSPLRRPARDHAVARLRVAKPRARASLPRRRARDRSRDASTTKSASRARCSSTTASARSSSSASRAACCRSTSSTAASRWSCRSYGDGSGSQPFETVADYDRWLARARQFPQWVDAAIAAMREGMARGRRASARRHGEGRAATRGPARGRSRAQRLLRPDRAHARGLSGRGARPAHAGVRRS